MECTSIIERFPVHHNSRWSMNRELGSVGNGDSKMKTEDPRPIDWCKMKTHLSIKNEDPLTEKEDPLV